MNRRSFINAVAAGSAPLFVPSHVFGKPGRPGANDRIQLGFIGAGGRGKFLMSYFGNEVTEAEIVAVADCYLPRCYGNDGNTPKPLPEGASRSTKYQSYRKMIEKEKLDAVFIETTTHARVLAAIYAMQAGLDVYAEKPVSLTIAEGRTLVNAVHKYQRVLQAGSQQRSMPINRYASEAVRSGKIGAVQSVVVCNYMPARTWSPLPAQPLPTGLDWDEWCNQTELRPYHNALHRGWGDWWDYDGGGQSWGVSGWGTHGLDQVQCALGTDTTGPVEMWTEDRVVKDDPDFPLAKNAAWKPFLGRKPVMLRYASGAVLKLEEPGRNSHSQLGGLFVGNQGSLQILRGNYIANSPDLKAEMSKSAPPPTPEGKGEDVFHLRNFLQCMRTREKPNADVETAHRATSVCHLVNICRKLDRKLRWDPEKERFIDDDEANAQLSRPRRKGYELPKI
jgi:predicted dehydrogenase